MSALKRARARFVSALRRAHGLFDAWRDRLVIALIAVAFVWLALQQHENHTTSKLAHKTAVEAKGTAEEAKGLAIISHNESTRLNGLTIAAQDAYCKLKLYDEISGIEGSRIFAHLGVLPPHAASAVRAALRLVASIPSPKKCDSTLPPIHARTTGKRARSSPITSTAIERFLHMPAEPFPMPVPRPRAPAAPVPPPPPRPHRHRAPPPPPVAHISPPVPAPTPPVPVTPPPTEPGGHGHEGKESPGHEKHKKGPAGVPCLELLPVTERLLCREAETVRPADDTPPVHHLKGAAS